MSQELNTIIVLRNDSSTKWADSSVVLKKGETGICYMDDDYGNVMVKVGDGVHTWSELKQVEGVLEKDQILTYSFGKHQIQSGKTTVDAGGKGMTVSEWIIDALKESVNPSVTNPSISISASCPNTGATLEIGSYINQINYSQTPNAGKYSVGGVDQSSGLSASSFTYEVSNNVTETKAYVEDGSFSISSTPKQINTESSTTYATVTSKITLSLTGVKTPKNNLGEEVSSLTIKGFDNDGTLTLTKTAEVKATGYRNTWYYVGTDCTSVIDGAYIRSCTPKNANTTSFGTVTIPAGTKRVLFAVPGSHTLTSVIDVDGQGLDVKGNFKTETVAVNGANGFTAANYTVFHFENENGIAATKYTVTIA